MKVRKCHTYSLQHKVTLSWTGELIPQKRKDKTVKTKVYKHSKVSLPCGLERLSKYISV